jgi:molecular chaperone DnaJ
MENYYEILGVTAGALPDEIKRAYRRLARRYHPDVAGGRAAPVFRRVRQAYETLSDERKRRAYDARLTSSRCSPTPVGRPEEWFADEVAIDFPSVAAVIERFRRTFFPMDEEVRRPLFAEIQLSRREASEGVEVPLDVPIRTMCTRCGGRGETWDSSCVACAGSGEARLQHLVRFAVPPGVTDGSRFRFTVASEYAPATWVEVQIAIRS